MSRNTAFESVLERTGETLGLKRLLGVENRDGTAHHEFSDREEFVGSVRPDTNNDFEISDEGQTDATTQVLGILEKPPDMSESTAADKPLITHPPVENDDRILVRGNIYRAVEKRYSTATSVSRFALVEDSRTPDSDTGSPGDDGGDSGDDPPFTMA